MESILYKEWKNKWFLLYVLAAVLLIIVWFFLKSTSKTLTTVSLTIFIIFQLLYNIKVKNRTKSYFFSNFLRWAYFTIMCVFLVIHIAITVGEINIAAFALVSLVYAILLSGVAFSLTNLLRSKKNYPYIIFYYLICSVTIIFFFGYFFALSGAYENSGLVYSNSMSKVIGAGDFLYFSSSMFYTSPMGDIKPIGMSKILSQIELIASFVIHVIVLGGLISENDKEKKNEEEC